MQNKPQRALAPPSKERLRLWLRFLKTTRSIEATVRVDKNPAAAVGLLASAHDWILRELSWHEPNLEQLFGRLATGVAENGLDVATIAPASEVGTMGGMEETEAGA